MTTDADTLPYDPDNVPYNKDPDDPGLSPVEKDIKDAVEAVDGVLECEVHMEWDPPWGMEMMSLRAKIELNMI